MDFEIGIKTGISYQEYDRLPGLRSHTIVDMLKSPAHCRYALDHPEPGKEAYVIGEAVHCCILEPERFLKMYVSRPDAETATWAGKHKNSKAYKDGFELWSLDQEDKIILSPKEFRMCMAMRDAAYNHPVAKKILTEGGMNEVVACWNDPSTGLPCKARLDRLVSHAGNTIILDLKTTRDASPWSFGGDCAKFKYNYQFAFYRRGLNVLDERPRKCFILALEKEAPNCAALYDIDKEAIDVAEASLQNLIFKYAECLESGNWPGYPAGITRLMLPKYSYYEEGREDE